MRIDFKSAVLGALWATAQSLAPAVASANDTTETYDRHAIDLEVYVGLEELDGDVSASSLSLQALVGYGIFERVSAYVGSAWTGDEQLVLRATETFFGVMATVLDTDHFDADVQLDVVVPLGLGSAPPTVAPSIELGLDAAPNVRAFGIYLRAGVVMENPFAGGALSLPVTVGAYVSLTEEQQALVEYQLLFHPDPSVDEDDVEVGTLALGYNLTLSSTFELIMQLSATPHAVPMIGFGLSVGLITTLPSGD